MRPTRPTPTAAQPPTRSPVFQQTGALPEPSGSLPGRADVATQDGRLRLLVDDDEFRLEACARQVRDVDGHERGTGKFRVCEADDLGGPVRPALFTRNPG